MNKHYIKLDNDGRVIYGFSDAFEAPDATNICINEDGGRHFEIYGEINPVLVDRDGCNLFKYLDGEVLATTELERQAQIANRPPEPPNEIEVLKQQLADARADTLMALNATTYLYEMILTMQGV